MLTDTTRHCTPEDLEGYFGGALTEPEVARLVGHLSACEQCVERAKQVGDALVAADAWITDTRMETERSDRIELALASAEASETSSPKRERYRSWRHRIETRDRGRREPFRMRYALGENRQRGALRTRGVGRRVGELGGLAEFRWVVVPPQNRIVVPTTQAVCIRLDEGRAGELVALIPVREDQGALFAETVSVDQDGSAWLALFESVGPGEYSVVREDL